MRGQRYAIVRNVVQDGQQGQGIRALVFLSQSTGAFWTPDDPSWVLVYRDYDEASRVCRELGAHNARVEPFDWVIRTLDDQRKENLVQVNSSQVLTFRASPEEIGAAFAAMNSDQQARFFDAAAAYAEENYDGGGDPGLQFAWAAESESMTKRGLRLMEAIGGAAIGGLR